VLSDKQNITSTYQDIDQQQQGIRDCNIDDEYDDNNDVIKRYAIPFIACGDLISFQLKNWKHTTGSNNQDALLSEVILDSDKRYPMNDDTSVIILPMAPPINLPYQESLH
jgi:hypothetical protein